MSARRQLVHLQCLSQSGIRIELDADGWRLVNPRQLGEKQLAEARKLVLAAEANDLQPDPAELEPPSLLERGEHVAKRLTLRITQRTFRQR